MPCTEAQLAANRRNAQKSTGPRTPEGKARSRENALKHGLTGEGVVLHPEQRIAFEKTRDALSRQVGPRDEVEDRLVTIAALSLVRSTDLLMAVYHQDVEARRETVAVWDEERRLKAEQLGRNLHDDPAVTVLELQQFSHGCDWLRLRWEGIEAALDDNGDTWDDDLRDLALDLLGTSGIGRRFDRPSITLRRQVEQARDPDHPETARVARQALRAFIRERIAALNERADRVRGLFEQPHYEDLVTGRSFVLSRDVRELQRLEAASYRRYERCLARIETHREENPAAGPPLPSGRTGSADAGSYGGCNLETLKYFEKVARSAASAASNGSNSSRPAPAPAAPAPAPAPAAAASQSQPQPQPQPRNGSQSARPVPAGPRPTPPPPSRISTEDFEAMIHEASLPRAAYVPVSASPLRR